MHKQFLPEIAGPFIFLYSQVTWKRSPLCWLQKFLHFFHVDTLSFQFWPCTRALQETANMQSLYKTSCSQPKPKGNSFNDKQPYRQHTPWLRQTPSFMISSAWSIYISYKGCRQNRWRNSTMASTIEIRTFRLFSKISDSIIDNSIIGSNHCRPVKIMGLALCRDLDNLLMLYTFLL